MTSRGTRGGPNQSLLTLLAALGDRAFRNLAAPEPLFSEARSRDLVNDGLALAAEATPGRGQRLIAASRLAAWTWRHRDSIDVIHAQNLSSLNIAGLAALISRLPIVVWSHTSRISTASRRSASAWNRVPTNLRWLAVSEAAAGVLDEFHVVPRERVTVVPNPIDPAKRVERQPRHPITVAYLGGPELYKGYFLVAQVVEMLRHEDIGWHVVSGPLASATSDLDPATALLRKLQTDESGLKISGWLSQDQVRSVYARVNIVLCPSYRESFGLVAAEAMANGIPVVASDIPAFEELLGDNEAGVLFPPGDAGAAADAIRQLAGDERLRKRLGDNGRRRARRYDPSSIAEKMLAIYQDQTKG